MSRKGGGGGGGAQQPGDVYSPDEFVEGLVVFMDGGTVDREMGPRMGDKVKPYSCPDTFAVLQPHFWACVGRRDGMREGRRYWAPLFAQEKRNCEFIDMDGATGTPMFVNGTHHYQTDQLWVIEDDIVIQATQKQTIQGKRTVCDTSTKARRNHLGAESRPTLSNFTVGGWSKQAATSIPKEAPAAATRDPSDPSRLFRDYLPSSVTKLAATQERDQKRVKDELCEQFPGLKEEGVINDLLPKGKLMIVPWLYGVTFICSLADTHPEVVFFQHQMSPYLPTLRTLHKYPWLLPAHQVDIGGCKFVLAGANLMCQGLTSAGGRVAADVKPGDAVAIFVEGKKNAAAVGYATLGSEEIPAVNQGVCVVNVHHLGDGMFKHPTIQ